VVENERRLPRLSVEEGLLEARLDALVTVPGAVA
jgi:hypothetical protein